MGVGVPNYTWFQTKMSWRSPLTSQYSRQPLGIKVQSCAELCSATMTPQRVWVRRRGQTKGSDEGVPQRGPTKGFDEGVRRRGPKKPDEGVRRRGPTKLADLTRREDWLNLKPGDAVGYTKCEYGDATALPSAQAVSEWFCNSIYTRRPVVCDPVMCDTAMQSYSDTVMCISDRWLAVLVARQRISLHQTI